MRRQQTVLLSGASGYVGRRLRRRLEQDGHAVRCLTRDPDNIDEIGPSTTVFRGDVLERSTLYSAFRGVDIAYFLIHFLQAKEGFEAKELEAAENFAAMARAAGVKRLVYLGALGDPAENPSRHLLSRQDVGHALRKSGIPTIELRASMILGEGSLSYDLIRDLTERLPVMVTPRWVSTPAQPIGLRDVLDYLSEAARVPLLHHEIVEIGGADALSYGDLMRLYARARGLKRAMFPVPTFSPQLSGHWIALFSRVNTSVAKKLIESAREPSIVRSSRARELFNVRPLGAAAAIQQAVAESETARLVSLAGFDPRAVPV